jgi:hypothetical protein
LGVLRLQVPALPQKVPSDLSTSVFLSVSAWLGWDEGAVGEEEMNGGERKQELGEKKMKQKEVLVKEESIGVERLVMIEWEALCPLSLL